MGNSAFNIRALRIARRTEKANGADEVQARKSHAPAVQRQKRDDYFVQISRNQLATLRKGRASAAAWSVFAELLWIRWNPKSRNKPLKFTNHLLDELAISRNDSKTRAIKELNVLGLIRGGLGGVRKSPIIEIL